MTTNAKNTSTNIPLAQQARKSAFEAHESGDAHQEAVALIHKRAADAADTIARQARLLVDRLNEAIAQLEAATTTKEAWLAASWLRTDRWDTIQQALSKIETLAELVD